MRRRRCGGQRGFVLPTVLILAVLYFAMMELLFIETTAASRTATRFRSRVAAQALAESAAELAAKQMLYNSSHSATLEVADGTMRGLYRRQPDGQFQIRGEGTTTGAFPQKAIVIISGHISSSDAISIDRTVHQP